jgi:hypothetical protein
VITQTLVCDDALRDTLWLCIYIATNERHRVHQHHYTQSTPDSSPSLRSLVLDGADWPILPSVHSAD